MVNDNPVPSAVCAHPVISHAHANFRKCAQMNLNEGNPIAPPVHGFLLAVEALDSDETARVRAPDARLNRDAQHRTLIDPTGKAL